MASVEATTVQKKRGPTRPGSPKHDRQEVWTRKPETRTRMVHIIRLFTSFILNNFWIIHVILTGTTQPVASVSLIALASVCTLGVSTRRKNVTFIGISCALIYIYNIAKKKDNDMCLVKKCISKWPVCYYVHWIYFHVMNRLSSYFRRVMWKPSVCCFQPMKLYEVFVVGMNAGPRPSIKAILCASCKSGRHEHYFFSYLSFRFIKKTPLIFFLFF